MTVLGSSISGLEEAARAPHPRYTVSVVAPVYNESATLREFVGRLRQVADTLLERYRFEFVLVDDGSVDDTLKVARQLLADDPRVRVIQLRRNFGQTAALQAGLSAARGEIVISMDADLQHFPEDIPSFLTVLDEGYDLVCGWRHERQESVLRRWPSRAANLLIRHVAGLQVHDFGTTFRAYRADLLQHIQLIGEQHRFVPALAALVGARIAEVKIRNIERPAGRSNYGLGRTLSVLFDILLLYFLRFYFTKPLKVFGKFALLLIGGGVAISGSLLVYSWVSGESMIRARGGWFLLAAVMIIIGIQTLLTGVLAEILIRVYYRTSGSAGFIVRTEYSATADRFGDRTP